MKDMTQEEKELLLKDLCARLPYHPILNWKFIDNTTKNEELKELSDLYIWWITKAQDCEIKPYLRPMSSMTEEEEKELSRKYNWGIRGNQIWIKYHSDGYWDDETECPTEEYLNLFDWLNAHHFDYRGLIEKDFAIEVTEENNPYKE